jgi:DNA primase
VTLSPAWLDELRARTTLSSLIAPSVKLLKAGREFKACCPFHQEKTPSFTVNDEKGFYHCFGCGAHGDAIRFLTDARGMPFMDAVKELADKAGMEVPAPDPRARDQAERTTSLTDVMSAVQKWFAEQLQGVDGGAARDYLTKRGIDAGTVARFGIGLAPQGRSRLKSALADLGEEALIDTGMLIKPEEGGDSFDRFRGRLMIPIRDQRGRVIAFGGRILGDGEPKYLNSPETVLFDKGRTLYNIDRAGPASRTAKRLIVVEGYMDVIALDRAGISETVAPNGTAVTEAQLERMWRLDPAPILCFDGDAAGRKAAVRAALRALPLLEPDKTLRLVTLPAGQDPDDVISAGGRQLFEQLLGTAQSLSNFLWNAETSNHDLTEPEGRSRLKEALESKAKAIQHPELRREFGQAFNDRFWETFRFRKASFDKIRKSIGDTRTSRPKNTRYLIERAVLLGLSRYPQIVYENEELVTELTLSTKKLQIWRDVLIDEIRAKPHLDEDALATILEASDASPIEKRSLHQDLAFSFFRRMADPEVARSDLLKVMTVLVAEASIESALRDADKKFREAFDEEAFARLNSLRARKAQLNAELSEVEEALAA